MIRKLINRRTTTVLVASFLAAQVVLSGCAPKKQAENKKVELTAGKDQPSPGAGAAEKPLQVGRPWGPEQATSRPDTMQAVDSQAAWASLQPDGTQEWLRLEFERAVPIAEVRVRESYNPGAVSKITAFLENGKEVLLWEGKEVAGDAPFESSFKYSGDVTARTVKIYIDSDRVAGWNEIDSVELVGKDGSRQWAKNASASTTYADASGTTNTEAFERARKDPAAAVQWALKLPEGDARNEALRNVARGWAEKDPAAAVRWVQQLPAGDLRNSTLSEVAETWAEQDLVAAGGWAKKLPKEDARLIAFMSAGKYPLSDIKSLEPSRVKLDLKNATATAILKEIEKQTGNPVKLGAKVSDTAIPVFKADNEPFWEVMDRLCRLSGNVYSVEGGGG